MAKPMAKNVAKHNSIATFPLKPLATLNITLYPCQYEKTENIIRDKSINLILTDPPYLVSTNDITRSNQQIYNEILVNGIKHLKILPRICQTVGKLDVLHKLN